MNKYQEALERAKICGDNDCCDCKFNEICINDKKGWYGTLKELVVKATPKKVSNTEFHHIDVNIKRTKCPQCSMYIYGIIHISAINFCNHCGQALDWGDEDD